MWTSVTSTSTCADRLSSHGVAGPLSGASRTGGLGWVGKGAVSGLYEALTYL